MAGIFGFFDFTRPGPGVPDPENTPPKPRIFMFTDIFFRKFWSLVRLNLLFTLFNLPALFVAVFFVSFFFIREQLYNDINIDFVLRFIFAAFFVSIPIITVGPAQAGFTYVLRNYSREEHAFLWWDFKDAALKNFKEGLIISLIDLVVIMIVGMDINIYLSLQRGSIIMAIGAGLMLLAFIIYIMMHMYIYPMLVTFKLSVKQILKNAFLFSIMRFIPNLLMLAFCVLVMIATFYNTLIGFFLFPLITMSFIGLAINFFVYPALKKHMIDKIAVEEKNGPEERLFHD